MCASSWPTLKSTFWPFDSDRTSKKVIVKMITQIYDGSIQMDRCFKRINDDKATDQEKHINAALAEIEKR
jgi:hypothetical protein